MKALLATTTLLSLVSITSLSAAAETCEEACEETTTHTPITKPATKQEWYGWQILASDAATLATTGLLLGTLKNEDYGQFNFYAGYLVAAPTIHLAHGNVGTALGSFGLRAGLPLVGAFAGCAAYG